MIQKIIRKQLLTVFSEISGDTTNMKDDRLDEFRHGTNKPLLEIGNRKNKRHTSHENKDYLTNM